MNNRSWSDVVKSSLTSPLTSIQESLRRIFVDGKGFVDHDVDQDRLTTYPETVANNFVTRFIGQSLDKVIIQLIREQVQVKNMRFIAEDEEIMHLRASIAHSALSYDDLSKQLNLMYHKPEFFITPAVELSFIKDIQYMVLGQHTEKYTIAARDLRDCLLYHLIHIRLIRGDNRFLWYKTKMSFASDLSPYQKVMEVSKKNIAECTIPKEDVDALENDSASKSQIREVLTYTFAVVKDEECYEKDALMPAAEEVLKQHTKMEIVQWIARDKEIIDAKVALCKFPMTPKEFGEIITAMCCNPLSFVNDEMVFRYLDKIHANIQSMTLANINDARHDFAECLLYNIAHMRFVKQEQMFFWYYPIISFVPFKSARREEGRYWINMTMHGVELPVISEYDPAKDAEFADEVVSDITLPMKTKKISEEHGEIEHVKPRLVIQLDRYDEYASPVPTLKARVDKVLHFLTGIKHVEVEQSLDISQEALDLANNA